MEKDANQQPTFKLDVQELKDRGRPVEVIPVGERC
jgi:hypothetical protein